MRRINGMAAKCQYWMAIFILASTDSRPKSSTLTKIEQSSSVLCPPPCFSLVIRCLRNVSTPYTLGHPMRYQNLKGWTNQSSNEENSVQLLAAQIIELHAYISPRSRFAQSGVDAGWSLWKMATTTNVENLKISALSALAEISSGTGFDWTFECNHPIGYFWHVIKPIEVSSVQATTIFDKVGLPAVLEFLSNTSAKAQVSFQIWLWFDLLLANQNILTIYFSLLFYVLLESFFVQIWDQAQVQEQPQPDWFNTRIPW